MHLINVQTCELQDFFSENTPPYAILSHTWGDGEVSYQEMLALHDNVKVKAKPGFHKITLTCKQAIKDGLDWAWVDTCCIDKTSSAELSEAINSMFRWYEASSRCYAYLIDYVDLDAEKSAEVPLSNVSGHHVDQLRQSRWFSRGWTLQELLAPKSVEFYSRDWSYIGSKEVMQIELQDITRVDAAYLLHEKLLEAASVAERMSWAADRRCTRVEDTAYCLLGIFDINIPLLYGEGRKAFVRLQEEIWKEMDDHSLLAWTVEPSDPRAWKPTSVFAESPQDFRHSGSVRPTEEEMGELSVMTKKGLKLVVPTFKTTFLMTSRLHSVAPYGLRLKCAQNWQTIYIAAQLSVPGAHAPNTKTASILARIATTQHFHSVGQFDGGLLATSAIVRKSLSGIHNTRSALHGNQAMFYFHGLPFSNLKRFPADATMVRILFDYHTPATMQATHAMTQAQGMKHHVYYLDSDPNTRLDEQRNTFMISFPPRKSAYTNLSTDANWMRLVVALNAAGTTPAKVLVEIRCGFQMDPSNGEVLTTCLEGRLWFTRVGAIMHGSYINYEVRSTADLLAHHDENTKAEDAMGMWVRRNLRPTKPPHKGYLDKTTVNLGTGMGLKVWLHKEHKSLEPREQGDTKDEGHHFIFIFRFQDANGASFSAQSSQEMLSGGSTGGGFF